MVQFSLSLPFWHHEYMTTQTGCWWFSAVIGVPDFNFSKCQSDKRISGSGTYSTRQPLCHEGMAPDLMLPTILGRVYPYPVLGPATAAVSHGVGQQKAVTS